MSDFLNNFSGDNYKKKIKKNDDSSLVEEDEIEQPTDQLITVETTDQSNKLQLELSGAAFEDEKINIDSQYNQFLFKRTATICLTILAVVIIITGAYLYLHQTVAITLVDKTQIQAQKWLDENNVNYDVINVESNQQPAGVVLSQSIPSGEKIGVLDLQTIEVSSGPNMTEVVKLDGLDGKSKQQVNDFIDTQMLPNAKIKYEYSDKVKSDQLIRIDFEDDSVTPTNYTRNDSVTFILSKGSKSDKKDVKVENFANQTIDKVYEWNQDTGIMIDEQQVSSDIPPGYIVSQSVEPGTMLGFGDTITIEVSKGPGVYTPNLIGYNLDEAIAIADENKINLEPSETYSDSSSGIIVSQSKAEGSSIYPDEESLKVDVSLGQPFINDMAGSNLGDVVMMINELNRQGANLTYTTTEVSISDEEKEQGAISSSVKSISNSNSFVSPGTNLEVEIYK